MPYTALYTAMSCNDGQEVYDSFSVNNRMFLRILEMKPNFKLNLIDNSFSYVSLHKAKESRTLLKSLFPDIFRYSDILKA